MLLLIDVESSDLLKRDVALSDASQPWPVSVAAELAENDGTTRDFFCTRVRADGRRVRPGAEAVHGISSRDAARSGVSEIAALGMLVGFAAQADFLIGFNVDFDRDVILATLARLKKDDRMLVRPGLELVDCMKAAAPICRIPSGHESGAHKWPSLDEALAALGMPPRPTPHNPWSDVQSTKAIYMNLRGRGALEAAA